MLEVLKMYSTRCRYDEIYKKKSLRSYLLQIWMLPQQGNKKDLEIQTFESSTNQLLTLNSSIFPGLFSYLSRGY